MYPEKDADLFVETLQCFFRTAFFVLLAITESFRRYVSQLGHFVECQWYMVIFEYYLTYSFRLYLMRLSVFV